MLQECYGGQSTDTGHSEQCKVSKKLSLCKACDSFFAALASGRSFGVLLWELASGEVPRRGTLRELR